MLKILLVQVSNDPSVKSGYRVGYYLGNVLGKILPFVILGLLVYWGIQYLKNRKK